MNEIININFEKQMVSARELHKALEVEKRFRSEERRVGKECRL